MVTKAVAHVNQKAITPGLMCSWNNHRERSVHNHRDAIEHGSKTIIGQFLLSWRIKIQTRYNKQAAALPCQSGFRKRSSLLNNSVNTLLTNTNVKSLAATPMAKLNPPRCPLLILCLIMEKITGPTEIASNNPSANPFASASYMSNNYSCKLRMYPLADKKNI